MTTEPLPWWSPRRLLAFPLRVAYLAAAVALAGAVLPAPGTSEAMATAYRAQAGLMVGLLATLAVVYRGFLPDLLRYLVDHPGQALVLVALLAILYGLVGVGFGLPDLFWSEYPAARALSALGVTLLLAALGTSAYYLDRKARANTPRIAEFLKRRGQTHRPHRLDPDPGSNAERVERFLRLARLPLLTLVSLPAFFPLVFPYVPRVAPAVHLERLAQPDVGRGGLAWFLGLAWWVLGLAGGIALIKFLLWIGSRLERGASVPRAPMSKATPLRRLIERSLLGLAVVLTLVDVETGFATQSDGLVGPWVLFVAVAVALIQAALMGHRMASRLHPRIWPQFSRFVVLVGGLLVLLIAWDRLASALGQEWAAVSPGMAVCALLGILTLFLAWLHLLRTESDAEGDWPAPGGRRVRKALPAFLALVAWIGLINNQDYKLQFPELDYRHPVRLGPQVRRVYPEILAGGIGPSPAGPEAASALTAAGPAREDGGPVSDDDALTAWLEVARRAQKRDKPKLVVVCCSGGASRAAYWTAVVLDRLGRDVPGFDGGIRLMTGASGGMVGASYYAAWRHDRARGLGEPPRKPTVEVPPCGTAETHPDAPSTWVEGLRDDSLVRVASYLALEEFPRMLLPRLPGRAGDRDRGSVLDADWAARLGVPMADLRRFEARGEIPSMVFTPVIVDDGRRLLVSNLDLRELALNRGDELHGGDPGSRTYSLAGLEFFKLFDGNGGDRLRLATAARMSATFPFFSPAVNLPSDPPRRVVDAGYHDNYGVDLAVAWIARHWEALEGRISGILLVQSRAFVGRTGRLAPPEEPEGLVNHLLRGAQFFTSPIDAIGAGRYTGSVFRNDEELAALMDVVNGSAGPDFFTTVVFENISQVRVEPTGRPELWPGTGQAGSADAANLNTEVAMTWYVTRTEKRAMDRAIPTDCMALRTHLDGAQARTKETGPVRDNFHDRPRERLRWLTRLLDRRKANGSTPGSRARDEKEFERALNYERIQAIRSWWGGEPGLR